MNTDIDTARLPEVSSFVEGGKLIALTESIYERNGQRHPVITWIKGERATQRLSLELPHMTVQLRLYCLRGAQVCAESPQDEFYVRESGSQMVIEFPTGERIYLSGLVFLACGEWCAGWNR